MKTERKKISKAYMKGRILAWIEWLKAEDLILRKELDLLECDPGAYNSFKIEDFENEGGAKGFIFCFDAVIY